MRIGIFGGSFDPVHQGHLIVAESARTALELEKVHLVPAKRSPHKPLQAMASDEDRLEMLRLAVSENPHFFVDTKDLERPAPSYTVDLLKILKADLGEETELFFIMGSDALLGFSTWKDPLKILELARIGLFQRPGSSLDMSALFTDLPRLEEGLSHIDGPLMGISSSQVRRDIKGGRSIRYRVPEDVEEYIHANKLYLVGVPE